MSEEEIVSLALLIISGQSSLNGHRAELDSGSKFRAVICNHDPGVPNWLERRAVNLTHRD